MGGYVSTINSVHKPPDKTCESGGKLILYTENSSQTQNPAHPSAWVHYANISRSCRYGMRRTYNMDMALGATVDQERLAVYSVLGLLCLQVPIRELSM